MTQAKHIISQEESNLTEELQKLKERDYLALSLDLLKKGELRLLHGDISGLHYFDMAIKLAPSNAEIFYHQGLALFEYGSEQGKEKELSLASKRFKTATTLDQDNFSAWHAWGNTLFLLGMRKKELSYFINAKKKYERALDLSEEQSPDLLAELYWDYGDVWVELAKYSGEATDWTAALKAYEEASSLQEDLSVQFWLNFGDICIKLGNQTNDLRLFIKAINCYKHSISITISSHQGWFKLGCALKALYYYTHDEDHFSQANECFSTGAQLNSHDVDLWVEWATLLLEGGELTRDATRLSFAIEKCKLGSECSPKHFKVLAIWSQSLASLGILTEKLNLIYEAQK